MGSILEGRVTGRDEAYGLTRIDVAGQALAVASAPGAGVGARVRLRVPARDVALARGTESLAGLSIRNQLKGRIVAMEVVAGGALAWADVDIGGGQVLRASLTRLAVDELALASGVEVTALIRVVAVEPGLVLPGGGGAGRD
jgi:molybdopterin-binding protein